MTNSEKLTRRIALACADLIYTSETDAPVTPYRGGSAEMNDLSTVTRQTETPRGVPVEESSPASFFEKLTSIGDWYGERKKARARKFLELQRLLETELRDLKVYRFGRIRIEIFVVGLDKEGRLAGIRTEAVET